MDAQQANGVAPKENGSHRSPPSYSVETPYGFHLDLDFVKYVEDIEKGNTIRRVQLQRRPRGRSTGNLSRNLSLPGYGCGGSQWNSTSILFPRTRLADSQQPCEFRRSGGESARYGSQSEAPYKTSLAFDEQPLGPRVRPNLLRASSLPLTVLLRKYSSDDPTSLNGSRDFLAQENGSSEDVFHSPGGANGTLKQLTAALQRVGHLEEEIRIIPELKAQICILQEERERLLHAFRSRPDIAVTPDFPRSAKKKNEANEDWMDREYNQLEEDVKASSEKIEAIATTKDKNAQAATRDPEAQSLVESLRRKIAVLEQKLHEMESDLGKASRLLKEQEQESRLKDGRIGDLIRRRAEDIRVRPDDGRNTPGEEDASGTSETEWSRANQVCAEGQFKLGSTRGPPSGSQADMEHHVNRVRELLQEQWECLCRTEEPGNEPSSDHLPQRVRSVQTQLLSLVNLLTLCVSPAGDQPPSGKAQGCVIEDQTSVMKTQESPDQDLERDGSSGEVAKGKLRVKDPVEEEDEPNISRTEELLSSTPSTRTQELDEETTAEITHYEEAEEHRGERDGRREDDDRAANNEAKKKSRSSGAGSEEASHAEGDGGVETDFMKACHFLEEHMDQVSEPSDEMRQALTAVFQRWFHVCAEENSCADAVALYINSVSTETPAVLQFLVNMVDDNGNTALHYSVSHSNFSIAKLLLHTGVCDVDLKNKSGYTAVMLASLQPLDTDADTDVVQQLMELGDVNTRVGQVGQTALHLAVRHGRASTVRLLLAHGANVNAQDQAGTTALISACDRGHTDIVRILLQDTDCDVNLTDKGSRSALSLATQASQTEIADLLKARSSGTKAQDKCKVA